MFERSYSQQEGYMLIVLLEDSCLDNCFFFFNFVNVLTQNSNRKLFLFRKFFSLFSSYYLFKAFSSWYILSEITEALRMTLWVILRFIFHSKTARAKDNMQEGKN